MSQNTVCQLADGVITGTPCPNGSHFEVKHLTQYGGSRACSNPTCPFLQSEIGTRTRVILIGKPEGPQRCMVTNS